MNSIHRIKIFSCCVNRERLGRCCIDLTSLVLNPLCRIEEVQNIICNIKSATSTCAVLNITRWYHRRFCLYTHKKSTSCSWYPVSAHAGLVTHVLCVCHLNNMYAARRSQPGRNNLPQVLWITSAWRARERAHYFVCKQPFIVTAFQNLPLVYTSRRTCTRVYKQYADTYATNRNFMWHCLFSWRQVLAKRLLLSHFIAVSFCCWS